VSQQTQAFMPSERYTHILKANREEKTVQLVARQIPLTWDWNKSKWQIGLELYITLNNYSIITDNFLGINCLSLICSFSQKFCFLNFYYCYIFVY
jgi:hypothetical protein